MIHFEEIHKKYSTAKEVVKNLNFKVKKGEICVLIGPSGCGKSTTLRMINRLIEPTSGQIYIDGKSIYDFKASELRRSIGYAIQEVALFPHMTVAENIGIVPSLKKWSKNDKQKRIEDLLDLIGLDPNLYKNKYPNELSGGERQRIGVARAMGINPPILLMDEPFGAVDPITRSRLQDELLIIQEKIQKTIIFVTHDIDEALKMGDKIAIMKDGKLVQFDIPKNILTHPANDFVKEFMGDNRMFKWLQLTRVEDVMLNKPLMVLSNDKANVTLAKMYKNTISCCLVVDEAGELVGSVYKKDLINAKAMSIRQFIHPIADVVTRKTTVADSFFHMINRKTNFLVVVDNKNKIEGLITLNILNRYMNEINGFEIDERRQAFDA